MIAILKVGSVLAVIALVQGFDWNAGDIVAGLLLWKLLVGRIKEGK